ncbi:MAG TPA: PRC-barrel domain-containing protein, partial [Candidatus Caenarcaniphilales bacterium]
DDAIEDVNVLNYSTLIGNEVITETGELLGKVRGFKFDVNSGQLSDLIIASIGIPLIPAQLISTYELPVEEIVSSGPERLIVFEGAEERLNQLTVGVLERLGISGPPWEQEEEEDYLPTTSTSNQLGAGRTASYPPVRRSAAVEESWEDEGWEDEPEPMPVRRERTRVEPLRQRQSVTDYQEDYEEEVEDAWSPASNSAKYEETPYSTSKYEDLEEDAWADNTYQAPEVNIPKKVKEPEYEQDPEY